MAAAKQLDIYGAKGGSDKPFADVLKRADQRTAELEGYADQGRARGTTCEQAYDAVEG